MLQKLLCRVWGHKTMLKGYTGQTIVIDGVFDRNLTHPLYRWERQRYCIRCGVKVHEDEA